MKNAQCSMLNVGADAVTRSGHLDKACCRSPWKNLQLSTFNFTTCGMALLFLLFCFAMGPLAYGQRPFAKVEPVSPAEVHWTSGFWAERFELCRTQMVPSLERIMEGTNYTQYLRNFEIAAGIAEGRHRGAAFNDGDFYKWM